MDQDFVHGDGIRSQMLRAFEDANLREIFPQAIHHRCTIGVYHYFVDCGTLKQCCNDVLVEGFTG
jgi:hypothetical protein